MKEIIYENIVLKIGQNANENWNLLSSVKQTDYFFHLDSLPSCYVILENNGNITQNNINYAANLCKEHTKYKNLKSVKVCYCECSNIKRGNKVGEVVFKNRKKVDYINV